MPDQVVVIPAHGLGTRLRDVTGGAPKTLVKVAGEPILTRLLRAAAACRTAGRPASTVVYTRPGDVEIPAFLTAHGGGARIGRREPRGYLRDIVAISREVGDEFTVLDCDLITPGTELIRFLTDAGRARASPATETMVFGVSAVPPSADPRSIRPVVTGGLLGLGPGAASHLPRAIGAYHWRPAAVRRACRFVADSARTQAPGSFHDYIHRLAAERTIARLITFSSALNVNTHAELELAADSVRAWRASGRD
jgi:GTP:adenosylcobinamide-phosphate guanylyltransferase